MFDAANALKELSEATTISFTVVAINIYGGGLPVTANYTCKNIYIIEYLDVDEMYMRYYVFTFNIQ